MSQDPSAAAVWSRRAFLLAAGACGVPGARRVDAAPEAAAVTLAWRPVLPSGAIVTVAAEQGLFAEYGLTVTLAAERDGSPGYAAELAGGQADCCVAPVPFLLDALHRGLDARFTTGLSGGGLRLLADRHTRLRHIGDLKHRRIGVADPNGAAKLFFSVMLRRKGINPFAEVTWVTVPVAGMTDAIHGGRVDAVALADPDAWSLAHRLRLHEIATNVSGSYRDRTFAALLVSGRLLRDRPLQVVGLTRALHDAARFVATQTRDAATIAASLMPPDQADVDRVAMLRSEAPDQHPTGNALVDDVAAYVDELRLLGTLPFELNAGRFARSICADVLAP